MLLTFIHKMDNIFACTHCVEVIHIPRRYHSTHYFDLINSRWWIKVDTFEILGLLLPIDNLAIFVKILLLENIIFILEVDKERFFKLSFD